MTTQRPNLSWKEVLAKRATAAGLSLPSHSREAEGAQTFTSVDQFLEHLGETDVIGANTPPAHLVAEQPTGNPNYTPPQDIEELFDRYLRGERDFRHVNLSGHDLRGLKLSDAIFSLGNLEGAHLEGAELSNCKFEYVRLCGAHLWNGRFWSCNFSNADLRGANLKLASLVGSAFEQANLSDATLWGADLAGARLHGAALDGTDLRRVQTATFSNNTVAGTRFSRNASDAWSVLRRNYTGPRLLFHLVFLAVFLAPYLARALFWGAVGELQALGANYQPLLLCTTGLQLRKEPVISLVLGLDRGALAITLTAALSIYNTCRALLTWRVGPLREEEERSHIVPALADYKRLYHAHLTVKTLFFLAITAFAVHAWHWLSQSVWLPVR